MDQHTLEYLGQRVDTARQIQGEIEQCRDAIALSEKGEFFVMRRIGAYFGGHAVTDNLRDEINHTIQSLLVVRVMQLESQLITL